ncbi:MAG: PorV/PorQ family protein [Candidatus Marinimicrobia bacterium]|jgi:hypothetical protein|nr:PorV/PorQ family protein [Candidatus Neomarinimicrobiota bacterium]MBT3575987.1 PorV/PorQ family protein [Candidatus Neomarinimicrobiota bacterium]MBT3679217.1 PorV/PorQ family protein [Candidatus Neomarinimicrobiota bacterium]MBT3950944.1 PorV/PorQ family protein [Candidatus Neomarinimicrobiota bacterium]MBT4254040.1 PorV/PorQ family protein [Candidatus Neomarinimicrobiota bacterium]
MNHINQILKFKTILIFSILTVSLSAQNANLGTAGAQFLKIPIGARSAALGGAVTGMSMDATALFWNPAGIIHNHTHALHVSHIPWMTFFDVNALAYTLNLKEQGAVGLYARALGMEKMEITTEYEPEGTGEYFDSQDLEIGVSYARKLIDQFSFGMTAKYIRQRIWNEVASGIAFDFGTHYNIEFQNASIAMSLRNFGPDLQMDGPDLLVFYDGSEDIPNRLIPSNMNTEAYPLPLTFQFGLGIDLVKAPFFHSRLALDAIHYNDNDEQLLVGLESTIAQRFILRGGYRFNETEQQPSLGVGLHQRIDKMVIKLDYAYVMHEYLGDTRFLSMDIIF